jgi:hypothetical protein
VSAGGVAKLSTPYTACVARLSTAYTAVRVLCCAVTVAVYVAVLRAYVPVALRLEGTAASPQPQPPIPPGIVAPCLPLSSGGHRSDASDGNGNDTYAMAPRDGGRDRHGRTIKKKRRTVAIVRQPPARVVGRRCKGP